MQFLVYIVLFAVSLSTVLLELHWLTSPGPQSRPVIAANEPPPTVKAEGPNVELSPVYPKPETPRSVGSVTGAPEAVARAEASAPTAPEIAAKADAAAVATAATANVELAAKSEPAQRAVTETTGSTPPSEAAPQPSSPPRATNVVAKSQCDVAACTAAFSSFRAADCTYQPFEGARQICVKPPAAAQRSASREQNTETVHNKQNKSSGIERDKQAEIERAVQFLRGRKAADEADRSDEPSDEPHGIFATDRQRR
jgi:hypothetical protein